MQTGQLIMPTVSAECVAWCYWHLLALRGGLSILASHAACLGGCATAFFTSLTVGGIRQGPTLGGLVALCAPCWRDVLVMQKPVETTARLSSLESMLLSKLCLVAVGR